MTTLNPTPQTQTSQTQTQDQGEISKEEQIRLMKEMMAEAEKTLQTAPVKEGHEPLFKNSDLKKT